MNYLLTKLFPLFVYPLGLSVLLCIFGLLLLWLGRKRLAVSFIVISVVLSWACSTRVIADALIQSLERHYPPVSVAQLPEVDAIIILGGMTRGRVPGTDMTDLGGGVDRLLHGGALFRAGKASVIVLSGGNAEGYEPESIAMANVLKQLGIPAESILLESKSRNTWQNALYTLPILKEQGIKRVLLVTSAYHMRRALAVFTGTELDVTPAATDYQVVEQYRSILDWLPQAEALERTTAGIKEYLGWWVYRWRGWIK